MGLVDFRVLVVVRVGVAVAVGAEGVGDVGACHVLFGEVAGYGLDFVPDLTVGEGADFVAGSERES